MSFANPTGAVKFAIPKLYTGVEDNTELLVAIGPVRARFGGLTDYGSGMGARGFIGRWMRWRLR